MRTKSVRYLIPAVFAGIVAASCYSQDSAQLDACMRKNQTQTGMNQCAGDEDARANVILNRTYQQLLSKAKQVPGATEKIEKAERAWMQYRDAYLDAMYPAEDKQASYGTIYPMNFALLRAQLTQEQTKKLNQLIKQYDQEGQ